jgi:hypothetical protein
MMITYFHFKTDSFSTKRTAGNPAIVDFDKADLLSGKLKPADLVFKVKKGFERFDFLDTAQPGILLCSQKVVDLLTTNNIKGWDATPVSFTNNNEVSTAYYLFHIYGKCGPFIYSKSEVISQFGYSFVELKGRYFDESSIDGNDIFVAEGTMMAFVNERLYHLMQQAKLTNIRFEENSEFISSIPFQMYQKSITQ